MRTPNDQKSAEASWPFLRMTSGAMQKSVPFIEKVRRSSSSFWQLREVPTGRQCTAKPSIKCRRVGDERHGGAQHLECTPVTAALQHRRRQVAVCVRKLRCSLNGGGPAKFSLRSLATAMEERSEVIVGGGGCRRRGQS